DREQKRLVVWVVLVGHPVLDRARRVGRQIGRRNIHRGECGFEIVDVAMQFALPDIVQLAGAYRQRSAERGGRARVSGEVAAEFALVGGDYVEPTASGTGSILASGDPRQYVICEVRL